MTENRSILEINAVSKRYGSFDAVKNLSFHLPRGEVFGFLGPNGAGKTSTLRMILGILKPDSGTISLMGQPWSRAALSRVGYLPEERGLYRQMHTLSIIAYFGRLRGLARSDAFSRAAALLERFDLKAFAHKRVTTLSKGMAQKVQLAAAIVHEPDLLILDEPFSGLDPLNQQALEDIIREQTIKGRSVLFSTHTMQHAERLCHRILILSKGSAAFSGTLAEARATMPRRVRIEADGDLSFLAEVNGVASLIAPLPGQSTWEVILAPGAQARVVLEACFAKGIALTRFDASDASLHEIFVRYAGADAAKGDA